VVQTKKNLPRGWGETIQVPPFPRYLAWQTKWEKGAEKVEKGQYAEQFPKLLAYYTQFPVLFDIIKRKKFVLCNYKNWEDKSDVALLKDYAQKEQVRVLCFKKLSENRQDSIHHWKAYADGMSGCRIDFNFEMLKQAAVAIKATLGEVKYSGVGNLRKGIELPFIKRASYEGEQEWRIVWKGNLKTENTEKELTIKEGLINRITFSANMPLSLFNRIKNFLKYKLRVEFDIYQSTIFKNEKWENEVLKSQA
jgi:hypothetical protein